MSASLTGGSHPGGDRYYVSGDHSIVRPVTPPIVANVFRGDTVVNNQDIVLLDSTHVYVRVPVGSGYNLQPFNANQSAIVFEQEFVVAQQYFFPLPLNTPYWLPWSIGWQNTYVNLASCFLVEEGPLEPIGGGLARFRRKYANLPPTRNVPGSWNHTFPALNYGGSTIRFPLQRIVNSRVQHDYFLWDPLNLQPGIPLFTSGGNRLNLVTGMTPVGLVLPEMRYFKGEPDAVASNNQLDPGQALTDTSPATVPSYTQYDDWMFDAEIVAEASNLGEGPVLGNIYQRRTRFVEAQ